MKKNGFTLIEIVITIVLLGIVVSLSAHGLIVLLVKGFSFSNDQVHSRQRTVHTLMARSLRSLRDDRSVITAASNQIEFIDNGNNQIGFRVSGNTLINEVNTVMFDLLDQVTTASFTYYDDYEAPLAAPQSGSGNITNIRFIRVRVMSQDERGQVTTLNFQVRPRELRSTGDLFN